MAKKKTLAEGWSISEDCLRPLGKQMMSISVDLQTLIDMDCYSEGPSPFCVPPPLPPSFDCTQLVLAFLNHKLELALVCLEVAVSVPFADRVRERAWSAKNRLDDLLLCAARALKPLNLRIAVDQLVRVALEHAYEKQRMKSDDVAFADTFIDLAEEVATEVEETGVYLVRAASAMKHVFAGKSLSKTEADSVPSARLGRPKERIKRDLIREAISSGVTSQKGIQRFVKSRLGTDDEVAPKMISEVKKGLDGHSATE